MRKGIFLVLCLLLVMPAPSPLWAGAYEQLLGMTGGTAYVPPASDPSPSGSSNYQEPRYREPRYVDPAAAQKREERRKARQRARDQARKKSARARKDEREDREWEEKNRERNEKEAKRQIVLKQLPPKWQLKSDPKKSAAAGKVPSLGGLNDLTSLHKKIEAMQKQEKLTVQQQNQLADLDKKMLDLWAQMVRAADTPDQVRKVLRLPIGFADASSQNVPRLSQDMLRNMLQLPADNDTFVELSKDLMPVRNGLVNFAGDYLQNIIAAAPVDIFEAATDAELGGLLKNSLAIAKVTMAFRDLSKGIASVADFAIGKIPMPQASIAETGRKIYTNIAFASLNSFMEKASAAVGVNHDSAAFIKDLKEEATVGQRAFMEWMGVK
ncbi:MAG: hypothetical protein KKB51_21940 [Candidatus Riflebacteria bacterium]|nr:hypothetical protein [Candidatus Riflebacteria bacterium]